MNKVLLEAFRYSAWATRALVAACRALTAEQLRDPGPGFRSILATLNHIVDCDAAYAAVIRDENPELSGNEREAEDLDAALRELAFPWFEEMTEPENVMEYLSSNKMSFRSTVYTVILGDLDLAAAYIEQAVQEQPRIEATIREWARNNIPGC